MPRKKKRKEIIIPNVDLDDIERDTTGMYLEVGTLFKERLKDHCKRIGWTMSLFMEAAAIERMENQDFKEGLIDSVVSEVRKSIESVTGSEEFENRIRELTDTVSTAIDSVSGGTTAMELSYSLKLQKVKTAILYKVATSQPIPSSPLVDQALFELTREGLLHLSDDGSLQIVQP